MFKELAPLLRHRAVLFTVSHVEDDWFRVNVIPKKITDGENDSLTTPVSITGTVEELDKELPQTLLHFVSSHLELKNSLEQAKAEMEEAAKAARSEARKKSGTQTTRKDSAGNSNKPAAAPEAPVPAKAESSKAASLFDTAPEPVRSHRTDGPADGGSRPPSASSEIEEDEEILREPYDEGEVEEGDEAGLNWNRDLWTAFPGDFHNSRSVSRPLQEGRQIGAISRAQSITWGESSRKVLCSSTPGNPAISTARRYSA